MKMKKLILLITSKISVMQGKTIIIVNRELNTNTVTMSQPSWVMEICITDVSLALITDVCFALKS